MKRHGLKRKLQLKKESLKTLTGYQLARAAGGYPTLSDNDCGGGDTGACPSNHSCATCEWLCREDTRVIACGGW